LRDSVWLHAVSVGEALSAAELIRRLRIALPNAPVFVSVGTLAGRDAAEAKLSGIADGVFYAPFDLVFSVRRVIARIRPAALIVLETEIWPNIWREASRAGCAIVVVNGRIGDKSVHRYTRHAWFFRAVLGLADRILVQSDEDRSRFIATGALPDRVAVAGNLKYDFDPRSAAPPEPVRAWLEASEVPLWIAASTVAPEFEGDSDEDDAVIAAWRALPGTRLLVAPRKPERFDVVASKWTEAGVRIARRSLLPRDSDAPVLLLDSIGELGSTFAYAQAVFMGGTLARRGGHNILEPALAGKPVVVGPSLENFAAIQRRFREGRGFVEIAHADQLALAIRKLLESDNGLGERGRRLAEAERGATDRAVQATVDARWNALPCSIPPLLLRALAPLWIAGGWAKRRFARTRRLSAPVISVGGLAMGGSGKTPIVRLLARELPDCAVLMRGYRRQSSGESLILPAGSAAPVAVTGDEAQMILRDGHAQLGIGADRYAVGSRMSASVFVLDDGFQHARLHRDIDIVVLDGLDPLAGGHVFPAGLLREPVEALRRAHAVVITRSEGRRFDGLLRELPPGMPVFNGTVRPTAWIDLSSGARLPVDTFAGKPVFAFCGLGNPESFRQTLAAIGCSVRGFRTYSDHHPYTETDLVEILASSDRHAVVTTEKDAVRLPRPLGFALLIEADVPGLPDFVRCNSVLTSV
jgi:3-deoxy-D-manno-octulosonic-acid transferase